MGNITQPGLKDVQMTRAKMDGNRTCEHDEQLAQAHCELVKLRRELNEQELKERRKMCEMEEQQLKATMGHLNETNSNVNVRTCTCTVLCYFVLFFSVN